MAVNLPYSLNTPAKVASAEWIRPSDWPVITVASNEVCALVNDTGVGYISFSATFTGTASVDWGDGSAPVSLSSGMPFTKYYTPGTGATCSLGYTTFKVTISTSGVLSNVRPTATTPVNSINGTYLGPFYSIGLLEMYYGDGITTLTGGSYFSCPGGVSTVANYSQLEYVKFPASVSSLNMASMFDRCPSIAKVILPTNTGSATSMASTFNTCPNLRSIVIPAVFPISSMASTFNTCTNLSSVVFLGADNLENCTTMASTFISCPNLISIDLPRVNSNASFNSTFSACNSLQSFNLQGAPTVASVDAANMFNNCNSLQTFNTPSSQGASQSNCLWNAATMFGSCFSLEEMTLPSWMNFSSIQNMFINCYNIISIRFLKLTQASLTSAIGPFNNCQNLSILELPTSVGSNCSGSQLINNCHSLTSITILWSTVTILSFVGNNLTSVSIPNATGLTSLTFQNCFKLTDVTFPSSMPLPVLSSMFSNCYSLKSVVIPPITFTGTRTNSNDFAAVFDGCSSLKSVSFTSFAGATYSGMSSFYQNMFKNCIELETLDLTAFNQVNVVGQASSDITQANMFNNCYSLKTLKLGVINKQATLNNVNISGMLANCQSLTSLDMSTAYQTSTSPLIWQNTTAVVSAYQIQGMTFSCRFQRFQNNGSITNKMALQSLRLTNTAAGQYGGASPQIDVSYTLLGQAALVQLFNDLPTLTTKTINITGCPGATLLTAPERAIATGKGWSITG